MVPPPNLSKYLMNVRSSQRKFPQGTPPSPPNPQQQQQHKYQKQQSVHNQQRNIYDCK